MNTLSDLVANSTAAYRRIQDLEAHVDWLIEGLSMIEDGEASKPKEYARTMIRSSAHFTSYAKSVAEKLK